MMRIHSFDVRRVEIPGLSLRARVPQQARSRRRFEKILKVSRQLIAKKGILELKMNDIAEHARIPIGSVYQYFPTKSALVACLFAEALESYHELGRQHLGNVKTKEACAAAVRALIMHVYEENRSDDLMQEIWSGVQADREIRALHQWDNEVFVSLFYGAVRTCTSALSDHVLVTRCRVINEMWDGTIRLAITFEPDQGLELVQECLDIGLRELDLAR